MDIPIIGGIINRLTSAASSVASPTAEADPTTGRPEPLLGLANIWGVAHGIAAAGITAAGTLGILSAKGSGEANKGLGVADVLVTAIVSGVAGLIPVLATQTVAQVGRSLVTPVADPVAH